MIFNLLITSIICLFSFGSVHNSYVQQPKEEKQKLIQQVYQTDRNSYGKIVTLISLNELATNSTKNAIVEYLQVLTDYSYSIFYEGSLSWEVGVGVNCDYYSGSRIEQLDYFQNTESVSNAITRIVINHNFSGAYYGYKGFSIKLSVFSSATGTSNPFFAIIYSYDINTFNTPSIDTQYNYVASGYDFYNTYLVYITNPSISLWDSTLYSWSQRDPVLDDTYNNGYNTGYNFGYNEGKQTGYNEGILYAQSQNQTALTIFTGIIDVGLLPINVFLAMFNYEVFGINIAGLVSSLLTVAIVVIVIRIFTGGSKND